jgi:hypothetical protein
MTSETPQTPTSSPRYTAKKVPGVLAFGYWVADRGVTIERAESMEAAERRAATLNATEVLNGFDQYCAWCQHPWAEHREGRPGRPGELSTCPDH